MNIHELLDGIYHFFQNELSNEGLPAKTGRKLFKMSDISDGQETEYCEMVKDMMENLSFILKGIESFSKGADIGISTYLGGKYQEMKDMITYFRNFLDDEEEKEEK